MNSFKTELFKVSFQTSPTLCVYIERTGHRSCGEYEDVYDIPQAEACVRELMDSGMLSRKEAIKVMHKVCTFFLR